jgi:hypothetical protein
MTTDRTITINLTGEDMIQVAESIGTWDKLWQAIGYLSSWNMSYPNVVIYREPKSPDLVAVYSDTERNVKYVIGAVWHDDHYGFHS